MALTGLPPDGDRQRDARLVLRRRAVPGRRGRGRARARAGRRRGRDILDVGGESTRPGRRAGRRRGGAAPRAARGRGLAGLAAARAARRSRSTPRRRRWREPRCDAGASLVNDVTRACAPTRRWPALVAEQRRRLLPRCTCSASRARCSANRAMTTSSTRSRRSWRSGCEFARRARGSPRSASCSTRASASARRSSTTSSCCGGWTSSSTLGRPLVIGTSRKGFLGRHRRRRLEPGPERRLRRDDRHERAGARARRERLPRARRRAGARCAGGGGCYVGRAMDAEPRGDDARRARRRRREDVEDDGEQARRVGHDRDHRALALHPPRRERGRARGRPAAGARPAPGRRRDRRDRDRLDRGHGRLRRGLPAGRADRPAALAQDARAAVQRRSPTGCSPTTSWRACG